MLSLGLISLSYRIDTCLSQGKSVGSLESSLCLVCHREAAGAVLSLWVCVALGAPPGEVTPHLQAGCCLGMQEKKCVVEAQRSTML